MNPCKSILENKDLLFAAATFGILCLECYLGKVSPDKVKAGSILELLYNLLKRGPTQQQQPEVKQDGQTISNQ